MHERNSRTDQSQELGTREIPRNARENKMRSSCTEVVHTGNGAHISNIYAVHLNATESAVPKDVTVIKIQLGPGIL